MDYIDSKDIKNVEPKSFDENRAKILSVQLIKAVQTLHDHDIVHGGLGYDQLIIADSSLLKIKDFGTTMQDRTFLTNIEFMAPEVLNSPKKLKPS